MSGDHSHHPVHGTAAGVPYVALPPTAVDATAAGPVRLIVAWPGFDPPRTANALAAAIPMTGVPVWRVYLDLPGRPPEGLGSGAILETETIEAYCAAVEGAAEHLPAALAEIRGDLGLPDGPVALAGFSAGGAAALLAVARDVVPVSTVALVAPVVAPSRAARAVEKRSGRDRAWTDHARALADALDLGALASEIAGRDAATLLIGGARDRVVPTREITTLRDVLRRHGTGPVESTTFRMGHALAAEPGTEARPPITEAVRVDGILTDWFRDHLAQPSPSTAARPTDTTAVDSVQNDTQPSTTQPVDTTAFSGIQEDAQPTATRPANDLPADNHPATAQPVDTTAFSSIQEDAQPTATRPANSMPADTQSTNTQPTHTTPASRPQKDPQPVNAHSDNDLPTNTQPVSSVQEEAQPVATRSMNGMPADTQPADTRWIDTTPGGGEQEDAQSVNTRSVNGLPTDAQPVNARPIDNAEQVEVGLTDARSGNGVSANIQMVNTQPIRLTAASGGQEDAQAVDMEPVDVQPADVQAGDARGVTGARWDAGHGSWSLGAGGNVPDASRAVEARSAGVGSGRGR